MKVRLVGWLLVWIFWGLVDDVYLLGLVPFRYYLDPNWVDRVAFIEPTQVEGIIRGVYFRCVQVGNQQLGVQESSSLLIVFIIHTYHQTMSTVHEEDWGRVQVEVEELVVHLEESLEITYMEQRVKMKVLLGKSYPSIEPNIRRLAKEIGQLEELEDPSLARGFLRVSMLIDTTKPLVKGCWQPRTQNQDTWIEFRYEGLQDFCYRCGKIGNSIELRKCNNNPSGKIDRIDEILCLFLFFIFTFGND
ncbi:hypothetical protein TB1_017601 [Malus domestica]